MEGIIQYIAVGMGFRCEESLPSTMICIKQNKHLSSFLSDFLAGIQAGFIPSLLACRSCLASPQGRKRIHAIVPKASTTTRYEVYFVNHPCTRNSIDNRHPHRLRYFEPRPLPAAAPLESLEKVGR